MPKMKTHKGSAKRFRRTGTGKIMRAKALQEPHPHQEVPEAHPWLPPGDRTVAPADAKTVSAAHGQVSRRTRVSIISFSRS
jgi:large subunit ribosomal protein L35